MGKCWERFRKEQLDRCLIGKCGEKIPNEINDNYFDPYGEQWIERWIDILVEIQPDFLEVHISYEEDHPQFYRFVNNFVKEKYPRFYNQVKDREKASEQASTNTIDM